MIFSKRKIIFIALVQILLFCAFFGFRSGVPGNLAKRSSHATEVSVDTTTSRPAKEIMSTSKEKKINELDRGSPKTVNLILYLIYRLTFKEMN